MTKILFVCYHHGCRGERLSVNISQHKDFTTLDADQVGGRTVIKNDYFNKQFLKNCAPRFDQLKNLSGRNIVVPSHYFYDSLAVHFPDALYVSIDTPKDIEAYRQSLYDRFFQYRTNNIAELAGECENRIREYRPQATEHEVRQFTRHILQTKDLTFGDIRCLAKGIEPSEENKIMLVQNIAPSPLSEETKYNSLVIAYENVDAVDRDSVVSYFNKSSGSL